MNATISPRDDALYVRSRWDVVVVGAGPAGAMAARELARQGCSVLLIDKNTWPRSKVCGACLNQPALQTLESVGLGHIPKALRAVPLDEYHLHAWGRSIHLPLPTGASLSREAFDLALVQAAVDEGAAFLPETTVRWDELPARFPSTIIIDASGLSSSGSTKSGGHIGAGAILPADATDRFEPGVIHMAIAEGGYVGLVRLEDNRLNVAAALDPRWLRECHQPGITANMILKRSGLGVIPLLEETSWRGTLRFPARPSWVAKDHVFRIGDAAGYIEPFTGEGMSWALASAVAVTPLVIRALAGTGQTLRASRCASLSPSGTGQTLRASRCASLPSGWSTSLEEEWTQLHRRVVGSRQRWCRLITWGFRYPRLMRLALNTLSRFPAFARPIVHRLNQPHSSIGNPRS